MDIQNKKIPEDVFHQMRQEVLTQWPTGKDVDLQEAFEYHKNMPESRKFAEKLVKAKAEKRTLIQPRAGVPVVEEHIKLMTITRPCRRAAISARSCWTPRPQAALWCSPAPACR